MRDQQILVSDLIVLLLVILVFYTIFDFIAAKMMQKIARKKGYDENFNCFWLCFWLGTIGWIYVISLPDLKQREQLDKIVKLLEPQAPTNPPRQDPQVPTNPPQQDVAWKLQKPTPETPKRDGRAEAYLCEVGMKPEEYKCTSLAIFGEAPIGKCEMCKKQQKTRKYCGIRRNNAFSDISVCTDCINVFVEYNPKSVYNFETKENGNL